MEAIVRRKVLGLVGLGIRGRRAVVGVQQVRDAARRGKLKLALVAGAASENKMDMGLALLTARGAGNIVVVSSADLASVCGAGVESCLWGVRAGLAPGCRQR